MCLNFNQFRWTQIPSTWRINISDSLSHAWVWAARCCIRVQSVVINSGVTWHGCTAGRVWLNAIWRLPFVLAATLIYVTVRHHANWGKKFLMYVGRVLGGRGFNSRWGSLDFFIDVILPTGLWPWGWFSLEQKWVPGISPGGRRRPVVRANNLTTFMCRLSWNSGSLKLLEP